MRKLILFFILILSHFAARSQWVAGYTFKSKLTLDKAVVCGGSNLTNFPILIDLTGNFLKPSPTGLISNANGYDIIFTSSDGVTILNHQIDHYISGTGEFAAWVQIPVLSATANTDIYMYYGNSSITTDPSTTNTWPANAKTIYHYQSNNFNDATAYGIGSTNNGTTNGTAKIGDGRTFDGLTSYIQTNSSELKTDNDFTISMWFKSNSTTAAHMAWQGESGATPNGWGTNTPAGESEMNLSMGVCCPGTVTVPNYLSFYLGDREEEVSTDGITADIAFTNTSSWQHVVATVSNMSTAPVGNLYLNGALVATNTGAVSNVTDRSTWATNLRFGRPSAATRFFNGQIDEARIYNTALNPNWICTEYNNQNNPNTYTALVLQPAVLSAIESTALAYTEDDAATAITSTLTATDWDNNTFASATVSITSNYTSTEDVLSFTTAFGISASWNATTGVLTLSPTSPATSASIANFISAMRAVKYQNTNNGNPSTTTRTVSFQVFDGGVNSNTVTRNITLASLNDAPVLSGTNNFTAINEDNTSSAGTLVSALISTHVTDADGGSVASGIAVTAVDNTNGTWQYSVNNGTVWNSFGTPTTAASRLLASDASTLIRFVPNANWNGTSTITYRAWDQTSGSAGGTANSTTTGGTTAFSSSTASPSITVNAVNDAPTFTKGADQNVNEDAGAQTVTGWATAIDDGDPELTQTLTFNVSNNNNALFSVQPTISATGNLTYTPAANANGTATVTVTLSDNGSNVAPSVNTSAAQTFIVTVAAVNDAPTFTKGADQNINEDAGAQTVTGWATAMDDGDPELTQTLTFNVSNNNNALFSVQPSINATTGTLTYTPAANANGTATVTVALSDNGSNVAPNVNTSAAQTFVINVAAINDAPSFAKGTDQNINEDAGAQTVTGWATAIDDGDPELTQTLTFNVSNNNNGLFSVQPAISATGNLTYTAAANANGTATVTVTLSDNGSNVAPNINTSAAQTFVINVAAVNDAPTFTKGADQNINEDAGAQTVTGWATAMDDGDPELTQTLTFNVSNNNNALFSVQPTISATGNLTYTPAANANGTATVTVTLSDNGSNVAPNVNTSVAQTFVINVAAINDAPSFTKGADQNINEDAGAQTVTGWATAIDDGDPELTQTLTFNVSNNNNALFSTQPAISASGNLTYTPAANANGTATVTVTLSDNGSNVAPNVNTSTAKTFIITVAAVNDAPTFTKGADQNINEDAGAQTVNGWATAIDDGDSELTQTLTFNVSNNNNALFAAQPTISATGNLTFTPAANTNGTATVTVTLSDNGSNVAPNINTSAAQTFIITIAAVNDAPSFAKGADQNINEDAGAQTVTGWATAIDDGDPELTQTLTFNVSNSNNALFSSQPSISATGNLTYTPAANANGTATVTVTLSDNGSNVVPNVNTSAAQTFIITVAAVNDAPTFTKGADQNINEDAGAQTVTGWATAIDDGDPELTQTLTFNVSNDNNALFSIQPSISATGNLTYTPAANINGTATVTVTLSDNGSNVAPNVNTSTAKTFIITVAALNDAPTFTKGSDQNINEDAAAQTVTGWATSMDDGDPELTQTLTFNVSNNNNALFAVQPSINATTGNLIYTPAANANGTATVTVTLSDNGSNVAPNVNTSAAQTFVITVAAVNDAPSFTKGADQNVTEDAGAQTVTGWATTIDDGDPELTQTLTFNVSNNNNALFSAQPSISATGNLTYTPTANANGTATVTVTLSDNGSNVAPNVNTSAAQTFIITVAAVNDAPSFTKGADQNINEDAGAQTVTGWATAMNDGDPELTQTLTFNTSNNNNALFSVQPTISATGNLTYTPTANANGTATITVTLSDNGSNVAPNINTSAAQTFIITVAAINDAPSFTKGADQNVSEDAGAQTVTGWATAIDDGDPELTQTLTFNVSNNNNALFSTQPSISATGNLTYTPAANVNGTATVTVTLSDNGSNVAPNVNTSAAQTFTITVAAVNDAPTFTKGADQNVNEDAGAQTVAGWATAIDDGDPELTQTLTFNVSNNNNALFAVQPTISATGNLTYTPAANTNGTATVTVTLSDNGSNVAPNANTSTAKTFIITVAAVNDAPSFTKGADQNVNEDAGAQTVTGWATAIDDGDPELTQTLTFNVNNNNNALFSVQPSISATGDLTYTPATNSNGTATVTVTLSDNGSNVAPNVNTSTVKTFIITVAAVNDAPTFTKGADQNINEDAGAQTVTGWATAMNDGDPELTQTLTFNVSNNNNALFSVQPSINATTGNLIYTPAANANGTATVTVTLSDNGSNVAPNVNTSAAQTFIITVAAINDAPSFTKGADQNVNEDTGAQTVTGWATAIDDGDPELTQTLTFNVSNSNNALFSVQPTISATGDLTYTSAANANGTATVTVISSDNGSNVAPNVNTSAAQTFVINVAAVNDAPIFTAGIDQSINENDGAQTVIGWATGISDGDPELTQTVTFNVTNDNNALFSVQPSINATTGTLTYTPAANTSGTATVTVTLSDNGSNTAPNVNISAPQTFIISVGAVNDPPVFTKGVDQNVNEDAGAQTVTGWATAIDDGDPDLTQTLTFNVSNNNNALFAVQPSINATNGTLTYTPATNANGAATVTVTLSDNGSNVAPNVNTSAAQIFIITVAAVNDAPTFTKGADQNINEDAGAQAVTSWATAINDGDPELTQTVTFNISNNNNALFSVQPAISATGNLTYTPAANANGTATVTVTLSDNGSNVAPNVNTSAAQTFVITVAAVNDAPTFTKGADQNVNEDAGAQSVAGWATTMDDGDPELTQTFTFNVSNDNNALFAVQPAISATGNLTYTPAANANGTATVTVTLSDNGSNVAPNVNTSAAQTFVITVAAVNDAPSFTKGADQNINEDAGAQTVTGWATAISDGDPELTQTLTFSVSNDNTALFSVQPSISATGNLTYTPAANANGSATVTVTLSDNGSNVAPNVNISVAQTFVIDVAAVNDVPVFTKGADQAINENAGAQSVTGWATAINDSDPEIIQALTFNVSNNNNALFAVQPSIDPATGTLTYTSAANTNGTATVTVTLSDNGSNVAPNVNTSATQTFVINVAPLNAAPTFTKGADQNVNEDAGAQTATGWATAIDDGDPELTQTLTFNVSNNNNALFSVQPLIDPATGTLTYTSAANVNGTATVTVTLSDNGSNVAPNANTSAAQTFVITVAAVNDAPTFTKGADQNINEDAGAQTVTGWATAMNDGDPELTQTLTFNVTNTNNALFSVQPSIDATTGTLTYTTAANANGTVTVTVTLSDNGSNTAPNKNISSTQTFIIIINPVDDAPVANADNATTPRNSPVAITILQNDTDVDDALVPASVTIVSNPAHGTLAVNTNGTVTYTPDGTYLGNDTFSYTVSDASGSTSNIATVTITTTETDKPPVAVDDVMTISTSQPVTIDVLANDSDPDGSVSDLTIVSVSNATSGTVTIENGQVVYQSSENVTGDDTFQYVIRDSGGLTSTATVTIHYEYSPLKISEGFSPNGDGSNDTWYIQSIENYPNNEVKVYDRWGMEVFRANHYNNLQGWNGLGNTGQESGKQLASGTYYYLLNIGIGKVMSGYITIVR